MMKCWENQEKSIDFSEKLRICFGITTLKIEYNTNSTRETEHLKTGQKGCIVLFALALLAAFTVGQKGVGVKEQQSAEILENSQGTENSEGGETGDTDKGVAEEKSLRVHREGKILQEGRGEVCVVLDAGHGGYDPGKIGINNALEKDAPGFFRG